MRSASRLPFTDSTAAKGCPHRWIIATCRTFGSRGSTRWIKPHLKSSLAYAILETGERCQHGAVRFSKPATSRRSASLAFDLDYYSSTKTALQLFEGGPESRLPRVYCYFDDIMWPEIGFGSQRVYRRVVRDP